ncbi:hypothetical protein ACN9ML_11890 [Dyadobacter endophyticus]|uniref:hypothetical protein n=1 Tax=Dyadobacter endophyticus TaxID=1749036 RepID=UPI003CF1A4DF
MPRLFIAVLLIGLLSCQKDESNGEGKSEADATPRVTDTTFATIKFDATDMPYIFNKNASPATLTRQDFEQIDSLLLVCVANYNKTIRQDLQFMKIDLVGRLYKKQLVAVVNRLGEKEVWVNCFCDDFASPWKTKLLFVDDGGSCFFNFKINLKSLKYYDFSVNGLA